MLEKAKTLTLMTLVLSSVYLTWQLWTFQPDYDYITPAEYVTPEGLADRKEISQLIKPDKIVHHLGNEQHTISYVGMLSYNHIFDKMDEWSFYNFDNVEGRLYAEKQEQIQLERGIEVHFATGIPFSTLAETFSFNIERDFNNPYINRIWISDSLYSDGQVAAMFISEKNQILFQARTKIPNREFNNYVAIGNNLPLYESRIFRESPRIIEVYPVHYVSLDPITSLSEYRYFYEKIPIEKLISYLFVDPTIVRQHEQMFYTDSNRGLQIYEHKQSMHFFHPHTDEANIINHRSERFLHRGIHFVNQHKGWNDHYFIDTINENIIDRIIHVSYRQYIGPSGLYPVYSSEIEQNDHLIQLEIQGDRVIGYTRPLIHNDRYMESNSVTLPAGVDVIDWLIQKEYPVERIESIRIGYKSELTSGYIQYEPHWIVQFTNGQRVFIRDLSPSRGGYE